MDETQVEERIKKIGKEMKRFPSCKVGKISLLSSASSERMFNRWEAARGRKKALKTFTGSVPFESTDATPEIAGEQAKKATAPCEMLRLEKRTKEARTKDKNADQIFHYEIPWHS